MQSDGFRRLNFDIDKYINPFVPRSRLHCLPKPVSRFLGHRDEPCRGVGNVISLAWSFVGAFSGIALIVAVFKSKVVIPSHGAPIIVGSFGAAAILEYNTIESPLSQPRNLVLGHLLSALVGVGITKLFTSLLQDRFEDLRWLAGALAVGASSVIMGVTKTVHPPAGATALLAATSPEITALGWYLLALVLLGSTLMLASACIINNIHRQFPMHWWTPVDLTDEFARREGSNMEKASQTGKEEVQSNRGSHRLHVVKMLEQVHNEREHEIKITAKRITIPDWLEVDDWERSVLEILRERINVDAGLEWNGLMSRNSEATATSGDERTAELPLA